MKAKRRNIDSMLNDIQSIRALIIKKSSLLQQLDVPYHLRFVSLISGLAVLIFCFGFYFLLQGFGSYQAIPLPLKTLFYILVGVFFLVLAVLKMKALTVGVKQIDSHYSLVTVFKEFVALPELRHSYILMILAVVFFVPLLTHQFGSNVIIPILGLFFGLVCAFLGGLFRIRSFYFLSYWFLLTAMGPLVFTSLDKLIIVAITWGGGFFVFGLLSCFRKSSIKGDGN